MFEPRWYRKMMEGDRFTSFQVMHYETDLWIGVSPESYHPSMPALVLDHVKKIRADLEEYILKNPEFKTSFIPIPYDNNACGYIQSMIKATKQSETGPFSAIAGMFAQEAGKFIQKSFNAKEVIIENGGDLYIAIQNDLDVVIYAGNSPLSNKIAITIPASFSPLGLCTSSGTVGHSFSYGKADAAMIACKDAILADAFATRFGNEVKSEDDIEKAIHLSEKFQDILSIVLIMGDKIGIRGKFKIKAAV